jgi:cytosine/adenosine deaminase-related metal-dependent hydrolase
MEALLTGTSTLIDHHVSPNAIEGSLDIVAEALERLGVRSILCYEVTDRDGAQKALAGVEENRRFLPLRRPLARGMVGAHASFTLSEDTLAACVEEAQNAGAGLHVHVAEDSIDQLDSEVRVGMGVVQRLLEAGVPPGDSLFAHCVHLHPSEIELLRRSQVTVAHNPRSNMNNGVGRAPVERLGVPVALGTDGLGADMFAEARVAYFRRREEDRSTPPDWAVLRLAAGAAFAGHLFDEPGLGTIGPGAPADLAVLEYAAPTALTPDNLLAHWIFGLGARHVRDVLVGGEVVVRDRRLVRVDQDAIASEANRQAERLWRRMEDIGPHPFAPEAA